MSRDKNLKKQKIFFPVLLFGILLSFSTYFAPLTNASTTKNFYPISDSYVSSIEGEENSNFGGKSYLQISYSTNIFSGIKIGYLMFHLVGIPSNAIIESAKLQLYTSMLTETHRISVHYSSGNTWNEYDICWVDSPSFREEASDTEIVAKDGTWYSWVVTNDVKSALDSTEKKMTLVVKSEDVHDTGWVWFYSRDQEYSWMEEYRPQLTVVYTSTQDTEDAQDGYTPTTTDMLVVVGVVAFFILVGTVVAYGIYTERRKEKEAKK